jgi:hypothetical protein
MALFQLPGIDAKELTIEIEDAGETVRETTCPTTVHISTPLPIGKSVFDYLGKHLVADFAYAPTKIGIEGFEVESVL